MRMFHRAGLILCLAAVLVSAERGCPSPEDIMPCRCKTNDQEVEIKCGKIEGTNDLMMMIRNARRYHITTFTLVESTLQHIPHTIFDDVKVKISILFDVTLRNLFDEVPTDQGRLKEFMAVRVKVLTGWDWEKMANFKNLENLYMVDTPLQNLSVDFRRNVSKKLKELTFRSCRIKKLRDDEFADFDDLEEFDLSRDAIVDIKRTMFPRRTKLRSLYFKYNKISTIPNDMFSDMPNLETVAFQGNLISMLSETTFLPVMSHLTYIDVRNNPIKCDCMFAWVLQFRRARFYGKCYAPKALHDKEFSELKPGEIRC